MGFKTIIVNKENRIATITLNRPDKLNAVDERMIEELTDALGDIGQDNQIGVVILTGAGRGFCSGGDLSMSIYQSSDPAVLFGFMDRLAQLVIQLRTLPQPIIASVNGVAAGGGCNLALGCDMIVASDQARFSEIFVKGNLHPDTGGTYFLPRLVGTAKAMEMMLTGRMVSAEEAAKIGLVNEVVPADSLGSVTKELAETIAKASPVVVKMIKSSIYEGVAGDLSAALQSEARAQVLIMTSGLFQEAK